MISYSNNFNSTKCDKPVICEFEKVDQVTIKTVENINKTVSKVGKTNKTWDLIHENSYPIQFGIFHLINKIQKKHVNVVKWLWNALNSWNNAKYLKPLKHHMIFSTNYFNCLAAFVCVHPIFTALLCNCLRW